LIRNREASLFPEAVQCALALHALKKEWTPVKYFAALLRMQDSAKSQDLRPQHLEFLGRGEKEGRIFARGKFIDGAGGLVIYQAESFEDARKIAESDPYITSGARSLEIHEWDMKLFR
jgi:hypothetical protein